MYALLLLLMLPMPTPAVAGARATADTVVLLHGLARSARSMRPMARALTAAGYRVCNLDYPSRRFAIEVLANAYVLPAIRACSSDSTRPLHFVTHSLGGILVRQLAVSAPELRLGRVVMLGPPNGGSEVVDKLGGLGLFSWLNGPAGAQLGTDPHLPPTALGPARFELGVIAGTRSINWVLSSLIPGRDDGKVSLDHARLAGMRDFLVVPVSHPFVMSNRTVIRQTLSFLAHGAFEQEQTCPDGNCGR